MDSQKVCGTELGTVVMAEYIPPQATTRSEILVVKIGVMCPLSGLARIYDLLSCRAPSIELSA